MRTGAWMQNYTGCLKTDACPLEMTILWEVQSTVTMRSRSRLLGRERPKEGLGRNQTPRNARARRLGAQAGQPPRGRGNGRLVSVARGSQRSSPKSLPVLGNHDLRSTECVFLSCLLTQISRTRAQRDDPIPGCLLGIEERRSAPLDYTQLVHAVVVCRSMHRACAWVHDTLKKACLQGSIS